MGQTKKQTARETDKCRDRHRGISRDRQRGGRHTWGQTKKQTARETDRWRDRSDRGIESQETDREGADIHGGRQRNKQLEFL